jgi:uncharacterized protein with NAD-binding domain and iron-sulfur cluster
MSAQQKKKVVILGGGTASLSTAFELTNRPDWRDRFESITVYQMGWRLGGKGASGRGENDRIEEHGLHIWMGWYANAFKMIQRVYQELGRPPGTPLATWDQAFKKHGFIVFGDRVGADFKNWPTDFPMDDEVPGTGGEYPTLWDYVHRTLEGLRSLLKGSVLVQPKAREKPRPRPSGWAGWLKLLIQRLTLLWRRVPRILKIETGLVETLVGEELLKAAHALAREIARDAGKLHTSRHPELIDLLRQFLKWLEQRIERDLGKDDDEVRRLHYILDASLTCIVGALSEGVGFHPHCLDALDRYDLREFLRKHGASEDTLRSGLMKAFYDLLFAYRNGDPNDQRLAAGVSLRFIFRMILTYKGAIFWKMQAGMGDTIFGPLYEVLKKRGVEFKFFHRVRNLGLSENKDSVARIVVGRQVTLNQDEYKPLFYVKGLPCWPAEPFYDQIREGAALRADRIDLESFWTPWVDREETVTLERGKDFDIVVFGIPIASIPYLSPELVEASRKWKTMVEHVETVRTQAVQLWLQPDLGGLGWRMPSAVTDAYPEPLNTWADMSHLIERESWTGKDAPRNITYFCAPMAGDIPTAEDRQAPAREQARVKEDARTWLNRHTGPLWPGAVRADDPRGLNWELLVDNKNHRGERRLDSQFFRVNMDPSERYTLSLPGTTEHRLRADDRIFDNLFVTGDWIYTGINAGCIEATVISGMLTANAICGYPEIEDIVGYSNP